MGYVVECCWKGRTVHLSRISKIAVKALQEVQAIEFGDGSRMSVVVRDTKPYERITPILGYEVILDRAVWRHKTGVVHVDELGGLSRRDG